MIALVTLARGDDSRIVQPRRIVVRTPEEWTALWAAHAGPEAAVPHVDFASVVVAGVFGGERPSAGHTVEIASAIEEQGGVRLFVDERVPRGGMVAAQVITSPYHVVTLPRVSGEISWTRSESRGSRGEDRGSEAATADSRPSPLESRSSSTGLKPTTAAALSYLAGPVSGATILFAESRSEFVRFHAWQSILGIGSGALLVALLYVLALGSLFVSASAVPVMVRIATALWGALIVLWVYCLWQALSGRRGRLPVVGEIAARRAAMPAERA